MPLLKKSSPLRPELPESGGKGRLAYGNRAKLLFAQGKRTQADAILEKLVEQNPHPQAYVAAVASLEAFGRREEAARWRRRAADAGRPGTASGPSSR